LLDKKSFKKNSTVQFIFSLPFRVYKLPLGIDSEVKENRENRC
jgi:hypothetical protein